MPRRLRSAEQVEVEEANVPSFEMFTPQGVEEVGVNIKEMMPGLFGRRKRQRMKVPQARQVLRQQEAEKLIDRGRRMRGALSSTRQAPFSKISSSPLPARA